jgi:hypothetical protein
VTISSVKPSNEAGRIQRNIDPVCIDLNARRDRQHEFAHVVGPEFRPCRHALIDASHQPFLGCGIGRVALDDIEHRCSIAQPVIDAARDLANCGMQLMARGMARGGDTGILAAHIRGQIVSAQRAASTQ